MYSDNPFLFVDVPHGWEQLKGTSFYNLQETDVIHRLTDHCLQCFNGSILAHQLDNRLPIQKFTKNSIYVITPYNA